MWNMCRYHMTCTSKARLVGKTAIITGGNSGIGKETARDFYARGARVILACRNMESAEEAVKDIKNNPPSRIAKDDYQNGVGELVIYNLDLSSFRSVRDCAKRLLTQEAAIHILVNNAGVMMCPYTLTEDGFEIQLQTNYLSHFLLTLLLLPKMQSSAPGCRIVNVSSVMNFYASIYYDDIDIKNQYFKPEGFCTLQRYAQSKTANILFTKELARQLKEANIDGINVYCLHPGIIRTKLGRHFSQTVFPGATFCFNNILRPLLKTIEQGAQTTIHCSVDENAANETGLYYAECRLSTTLRKRSDEMAKKLWDYTCKLLHLKPDDNFAVFLKTVACQIADPDSTESFNYVAKMFQWHNYVSSHL